MKNKSARHKEENTFKFQPFSERIGNIDVDIFHRVEHEYELQAEEDECFLFQSIQKWNVLNLSESYDVFRKDVQPHSIITLPQLLHRKGHVIDVLLKHIENKNVLCLQPLLEFVVALAKDLRKEFYEYYPKFLTLLIDLLHTKDTDQVEWAFTCLAYLFKFLWRSLIKDIGVVFNTLLPLLSDNKPQYINNFAAESFAFVARKVKDKQAFLRLILKVVENEQDGISGCGKLLFEVTNGVNRQFHSCAEVVLPFLIESLTDNSLQQKALFEILEHVIANIVSHIQPANGELLWKTLNWLLQKETETWTISNSKFAEHNLELILTLLGQAIEYKNGRFLQSPVPVIDGLVKILALSEMSESVILTVVKIAVVILLSTNIKLPQEQASGFTRKILSVTNANVLLYFVDNTSSYSLFEALILPMFLKYCVSIELETKSLHVLTQLILKKSPPSGHGLKLNVWNQYQMDFHSKSSNAKMQEILWNHIKIENVEQALTNTDNYLCALICLPHLNTNNTEDVGNQLLLNLKLFCGALCEANSEETHTKKILFLLCNTLECSVHLNIDLVDVCELITDAVLPFATNVSYVCALKILDLYYTACNNKASIITMDKLMHINGSLENNFNSPFHYMRLFTSHIYTLFEHLPELKPATSSEDWKVFTICYNVESTEPHVHTYREQLQNLERLAFERQQMAMCKETDFKTIPLRYLCGVLYINFRLLWEPVSGLIASFAHGLKVDIFWSVFALELKSVVSNARSSSPLDNDTLQTSCEFLEDLYQSASKIDANPDFTNYRLLLWKAMAGFADIAEIKTRDSSELLLKFFEEEYTRSNSEVAMTCNIKQNTDIIDVVHEEEEEEKPEETEGIKKNFLAKADGKNKLKILLVHLKVFSKIRSPKSMYKEPELYKLYFELLSHKHHEVQKLAMDCIMTYKPKYLVPYQDNLYKLIDDKNFKNELAVFRVDKDSTAVQEEHRENLMPIVMRIVFSKMFAKIGLRTGGKSSGQLRRTLVLRFLAGCHEKEILSFIHMTFKYYSKYHEDDVESMVETITKNADLEKFIPPKRLQSTVNLLSVIVDQFGGLMCNELLKYVFKIALIVGASVKGAFEQNTNVHAGYLNALRNIRSSCIKVVERFFQRFETYPWTGQEMNALFESFVYPYLDKLSVEGIHSPTPLLKLFVLWGSVPRYFPLLVNHAPNDMEKYALPNVMKLLLNGKTHISVTNIILEMVEKLLTLQADEEDSNLKIPVRNLLPVKQDILNRLKINEKLNYGSCILLPHVPCVLEKIKIKLKNKSKNINHRELFILSRVSELVWEADISDTILELLLPVVLKKCSFGASEEIVLQFVTTILNLLNNVESPQKHLRNISPLFGDVVYPGSRKVLCQILELLSRNCEQSLSADLKLASRLITELNAWDAKWIDQPDFQRRLDAFKEIQSLINGKNISFELGILIIYDCYYLIKSEKDLSLKESASHCLKSLGPVLVNCHKMCNETASYIIDDTLLRLIRNGLKSKHHDVRNECISLLGCLARECPDAHVVLRDLNKLTNKADMEVDFFENLTHLQVHRHARALLKFCQVFRDEITSPNPRTLTQFILPLTSHYLLAEKYAGKNSIVDAAIETVSLVCKILPWHQYEGMLKYYLGKLKHKAEFQRQLVRLIVAILDSFHFDLSKGHVDYSNPIKTEPIVSPETVETTQESTEVEKVNAEDEEKELDEALDDIQDPASSDENEDETQEIAVQQKVCEKIAVLCKSTASRVIKTIQIVLLPQLHKTLAEMTQHESSHKVNRKRTGAEREEEDLLRVPISLAVVKLLQRLPKQILEANLPGVFMKLCTFLKSQLDSVRRAARETLQKIMVTLGPEYLSLLIGEISPLMTRGYQVHVLVYTLHSVLTTLKELYKPKDIDKVLLTVLDLCKMDLFGNVAEEREVAKIVSKVSEAKSSKSLDTFQILAQFITDKCLMDLILPLKNVLLFSHSFKVVSKAQECLRHIAMGLVDNQFVPVESLLKFAYGTASESIPQFLVRDNKPNLTEQEREKLERQKEDCLIIPKEPVYRSGFRTSGVKKSAKTNSYVLVEFGLRLCFFLLKRDRLREFDYRAFMDPFVSVFQNCLTSKHVKLCTVTMQCLAWVLKYELPSLKENIKEITLSMFGILHKYASSGLSKGDNFDLVVAAFKTMSILVRDAKYHTIETDQLKILLLYVEQDLHDYDRQATAFGLLKAIISRKLVIPEMHDIMAKVAELSITSELPHIRLQSRLVFHQFIMDYPLGSKLDRHISFYLAQLNYERQSGRESALTMIQSLVTSFPYPILKKNSGTFLVTLGARLVNDESPDCKKMVSSCLGSMLKKLLRPDLDPLFDIIILWFKDKKVSHRCLAAQLCGIVISVEKAAFETRIPALMPVILSQFGLNEEQRKPGQFVLLNKSDPEEDSEKERVKDHHLYLVLQMLLKMCAQCPSFLKLNEDLDTLSTHVQTLLAYPHEWVRLASAQFLGYVLSSLNIDRLAELLATNKSDEANGYLYSDPKGTVKSLALDLCAQLVPGSVKNDLAEQVIKNLVFIARVLQEVPFDRQKTDNNINLLWLTKRMRKIVNTEVVEASSSTVLRTEVFKWIAAVGTALKLEQVRAVLNHLLAPLVREMITVEESNAPLRQLSKEVANILKKRIGVEEYTNTLQRLQQHISVKRAERKRTRNQLAVTDPEIYAKRKIKRHEKKKEAKKRRISERKGAPRTFKKRKVVDLEDNSEIM